MTAAKQGREKGRGRLRRCGSRALHVSQSHCFLFPGMCAKMTSLGKAQGQQRAAICWGYLSALDPAGAVGCFSSPLCSADRVRRRCVTGVGYQDMVMSMVLTIHRDKRKETKKGQPCFLNHYQSSLHRSKKSTWPGE